MRARDLFAGLGWDLAAHGLGIYPDGWEIDSATQETRRVAGLKTAGSDVRDIEPVPGSYHLDIASPPCPTFAQGGKGAGRMFMDRVLDAVAGYRGGRAVPFEELAAATGDDRTALVLEPLRVCLGSETPLILWEQVPPVLPVWDACAAIFTDRGYSVVTGVLDCADYGIPQVRKRAFLLARRDGTEARFPSPTHAGRRRSMADELGWGMTARPYPTIAAARTSGGPDKEKVGGSGARASLYAERSAGRWIPHPDPVLAADPSIRLSLEDIAALQTFPRGLPFYGTARERFRQISNAVPPLMAAAMLAEILRGPHA